MNETLLEQYRRDPAGVILRIEAAARRERARVLKQLFRQAVAVLFGARTSRPAAPVRPLERHAPCT